MSIFVLQNQTTMATVTQKIKVRPYGREGERDKLGEDPQALDAVKGGQGDDRRKLLLS